MDKLRILFIALYSDKYPSIGESHGTSVVAGAVLNKCSDLPIEYFEVIDMVALGDNTIDYIEEKIKLNQPTVIGFSVNYGTYDILKNFIDRVRPYINSANPLVLFGGPISTYIPDIIFQNIYSQAKIVVGEGDEAAPMAIRSWFNKTPLELIPNLCYKIGNEVFHNQRRLVMIDKVSLPYRGHIESVIKNNAQVYVESSRGCSWAICTFCLRGLTDVNGKRSEYRRFNNNRLFSDILTLVKHDITALTFTDEDFLGGDIEDNDIFINDFDLFCKANRLDLSFDASLTVHSIFSKRYSVKELERIKCQLLKLKKIGLSKIFLGIESGTDSQLKRFEKGHNSSEALNAINILNDIGFDIELGFIMFDPLCSLSEIESNIDFLYDNDLVEFVSFLTSELRLQINSHYLKYLKIKESIHGKHLYKRKLDYNTLSYSYEYLDKDVNLLVEHVRYWNTQIKDIHYPLKNLSRYGKGGILGKYRANIVQIIVSLRKDYFQLLKNAINEIKLGVSVNKLNVNLIMLRVSEDIIELSNAMPPDITENIIFKNVLNSCKSNIEDSQTKE